jgi:hypothetical protein
VRQFDVAADTATSRFFGAAVGSLHDARASPGHDGETHVTGRRTHVAGQLIVRVILLQSGRSEHGDTRASEVQAAKAAQHLAGDSIHRAQLAPTQAWATEETSVMGMTRLSIFVFHIHTDKTATSNRLRDFANPPST